MVSPTGRRLENSMIPGISISSDTMLTQKCGVTDLRSLNSRQTTPMLRIAAYVSFQSCGRSGTSWLTSGIGTVDSTASAGTSRPPARTAVTRPPATTTRSAGGRGWMGPPFAVVSGDAAAWGRRAQIDASPFCRQGAGNRLHQRFRSALDVAKLLLEDGAA